MPLEIVYIVSTFISVGLQSEYDICCPKYRSLWNNTYFHMIEYILMYLQWNLARCQCLLIERQTAQFTQKWEAMVKPRNLDDFPRGIY